MNKDEDAERITPREAALLSSRALGPAWLGFALADAMQQIHPPTTEVFSFPLVIALIPVAVCVLCIAVGALCFRRQELRRFGYMLFVVALIAGGLFAPAMLQDRIVMSPREISTTTGFWFAPTLEGFVYEEVQFVRLTTCRDPKVAWVRLGRFTIGMAGNTSLS